MGHDETRTYGTKTREWMMDTVIHLERIERQDNGRQFSARLQEGARAHAHNPGRLRGHAYHLVNNVWEWSGVTTGRKAKISPLGEKFLDALKAANAGSLKAVPLGRWKEQCIKRGLIDPNEKPDSARTLFNKHRRELIAANLIVSNETEASILT